MNHLGLKLILCIGLFTVNSAFAKNCVEGNYSFALGRKVDPEKIQCIIKVGDVTEDDSNFSCHFSVSFRSADNAIYAATYNASYSCDRTGMYGSGKLLMSFWTGVTLPFLLVDQGASAARRSSARSLVYENCHSQQQQLQSILCSGQ